MKEFLMKLLTIFSASLLLASAGSGFPSIVHLEKPIVLSVKPGYFAAVNFKID